jgi:hypothetical protein
MNKNYGSTIEKANTNDSTIKLSSKTMTDYEKISLNFGDYCNIDSFPFIFILLLIIFGFVEGLILNDKFD